MAFGAYLVIYTQIKSRQLEDWSNSVWDEERIWILMEYLIDLWYDAVFRFLLDVDVDDP